MVSLMQPSKSSLSTQLGAVLVFGLLLAWFGWVSLERLASGDEGFYLYAASLLTRGKLLYTDFFYPQAPLLPYLYTLPFLVGGESWQSARLFSAIFPAISGGILYLLLVPSIGRFGSFVGVLFFATSVFVFPWFPTAQTYGPSIAFLLASYFYISRERLTPRTLFLSGLFLGLTVGVRIFFVGLLPLFLCYLWVRRQDFYGTVRTVFVFFFCGFVLSLLPHIYFFLLDPEAYWFNNLGYHLGRSGRSFSESLEHKLKVLQVLSGLRESQKFEGYQFALFLWGFVGVGLFSLLQRKSPIFSFYVACGLCVLHFLPEPTYVQYFSTIFPFLILAVFQSCHGISRAAPLVFVPAILLVFVFSLNHFQDNLVRYTETGQGVLGIPSEKLAEERTLAFLENVSRDLNSLVAAGTPVATLWPGYLIGTHLEATPGFENHFTFRAGNQLGEEARRKYHVLRLDEVLSMVSKKQVSSVLGWKRDFRGPLVRELNKNGYEVRHAWGTVQLREQSKQPPNEQ